MKAAAETDAAEGERLRELVAGRFADRSTATRESPKRPRPRPAEPAPALGDMLRAGRLPDAPSPPSLADLELEPGEFVSKTRGHDGTTTYRAEKVGGLPAHTAAAIEAALDAGIITADEAEDKRARQRVVYTRTVVVDDEAEAARLVKRDPLGRALAEVRAAAAKQGSR